MYNYKALFAGREGLRRFFLCLFRSAVSCRPPMLRGRAERSRADVPRERIPSPRSVVVGGQLAASLSRLCGNGTKSTASSSAHVCMVSANHQQPHSCTLQDTRRQHPRTPEKKKRCVYTSVKIERIYEKEICGLRNGVESETYRVLWGTVVNRTYGKNKNLYMYLFLLKIYGPIYYGPP